jgi:Uma2 family endonuclease
MSRLDQPIMVDLRHFASGGLLTEEDVERARAELRETDGEPLESPWHRAAIALLIEVVVWQRRGQPNYFAGGNMFLFFSRTQARKRDYKGPDFFFVKDVDGTRPREYWWVYEEDGRFPNLIIELLSRSTADEDRTTKKDLYEKLFRTPEYFYFDPETRELVGLRLVDGRYERLQPNERGWIWSEEMGVWVGTWEGTFEGITGTWVRFYDTQGNLLLTEGEAHARLAVEEGQRAEREKQSANEERQRANEERQRADEERQRAEGEKHRADELESELARLRMLLKDKGIAQDEPK